MIDSGVFDLLEELSNEYYLNYIKTISYYSISNIRSTSILGIVVSTLAAQDDFEVIVETERKNGELTYTVAGENVQVVKEIDEISKQLAVEIASLKI